MRCMQQLSMLQHIVQAHFLKWVRTVVVQRCGSVVLHERQAVQSLQLTITWEVKRISLGGNGMNPISLMSARAVWTRCLIFGQPLLVQVSPTL